MTHVRTTFYILGSALGAHPYPMMVRDFHRVIGEEARRQILAREGRLPHLLIACVGGGSNAIGLFHPFLEDDAVRMVGVEAGGEGVNALGRHAARFEGGRQIQLTHSVSAGLDYAAVGPEHSHLRDLGRAEYVHATDEAALAAFHELSETEGIIPALETAHAVAHAIRVAPTMRPDEIILVNLSGRGDKDVQQVAEMEDMMESVAVPKV